MTLDDTIWSIEIDSNAHRDVQTYSIDRLSTLNGFNVDVQDVSIENIGSGNSVS